jgi:hypothetical protein
MLGILHGSGFDTRSERQHALMEKAADPRLDDSSVLFVHLETAVE